MIHFLKDIKRIIQCVIATACLSACMVEVPSHIIQPTEMENLLYDYHLMQAMAGDLKSSEGYKRKQYEQYVFDKHRVTEAEFDSSLTWYMRHTKELEAIYKNLGHRFSAKKEELEAHIPPYERIKQPSKAGDTVDVWEDFRLMRMTVSPINNKMTFILSPDSNYHLRDSLEWRLKAIFLGDTAESRAVMGLTLMYDKDTLGKSCIIDHSGRYSLSLACDSDYQLKEIHGQIYYYNRRDEQKNLSSENEISVLPVDDLLLSDIAVIRYHRKDTVIADSINHHDIDQPNE